MVIPERHAAILKILMANKKTTKKPAAPKAKKKPVKAVIAEPVVTKNRPIDLLLAHRLSLALVLAIVLVAAVSYGHYRNTRATCVPTSASTTAPSASGLSVTKPQAQTLGDTTESDFVSNPVAPSEAGSTLQQHAGTLNQAPTSTLQAPTGTGGLDPSQF